MTEPEITSHDAAPAPANAFPRPNRALVEFTRVFVAGWFCGLHGARWRGAHRVPREGPLILAPNHLSYYDPPLVATGAWRLQTYFANDYLFRIPVLKQIISALGAFRVRRNSLRSAYETAKLVLEHGGSLVMFPEGTRSRDGRVGPLQDGVARLALSTGAAIVPVSIFGGWEAWPRRRKIPRPFRPLSVIYHAPIRCEIPPDRAALRRRMAEVTRQLEVIYHRAWRHRRLIIPGAE